MAKVYKNLFPQVYLFSRLRRSFYSASRGKHKSGAIAKFSFNLEENLHSISAEVQSGIYEFGPYHAFYVNEPKKRLIESACFSDRVIHHSIHDLLEPIYDPTFYEHSYACRSGRGHHAAVLRLHGWIKGNPNRFFLKCDIKKFFPSIDRKILLNILGRTLHDKLLMDCLTQLVMTAPGTNGIPIGNLTSQLFANIYLNELDQFIKRKLQIRHYIRYMDDFVLVVDSKIEAENLRLKIETYLNLELKLIMSPHKVLIASCVEGISFLGFLLKPKEIRLKGTFYRRLRKKVTKAQHRELLGQGVHPRNPSPLQAVLNSYAGHVRFCTNPRPLQEYLMGKAMILNSVSEICN